MSDNRATITIPRDAFPAIMDAVQRAVIDRGASQVTRKAAFSALLALVEAGLVIGDTSAASTPNDEKSPAKAGVSKALRLAAVPEMQQRT